MECLDVLQANPEKYKPLAGLLRRQGDSSERTILKVANIEDLLAQVPRLPVREKLDRLLLHLASATARVDSPAKFSVECDFPLIFAADEMEVSYFLGELQRRGLASLTSTSIRLTFDGWERVEELQAVGTTSLNAFVAMWFTAETQEIYTAAIEPAVRSAGYEPIRMDQVEHVNRIDDQIIADIRRSRFMVADFTGQRQGVYFEAGMMMGLGRRVIWMCKRDQLRDVHFDNRQYNFIDYENAEEARLRLYRRILALEGEGSVTARAPS
jgi:hypothetical protein